MKTNKMYLTTQRLFCITFCSAQLMCSPVEGVNHTGNKEKREMKLGSGFQNKGISRSESPTSIQKEICHDLINQVTFKELKLKN